MIYALCWGGGCLSDSEALNDDPLARELSGVGRFADQSQVGEWLREQSQESVAALRGLLHEFVTWVWQAGPAPPAAARADSGSSAGVYLEAIAAERWHYTVSSNKWTGPLELTAQALPALAWKESAGARHALLRHQPEGRSAPQRYAVVWPASGPGCPRLVAATG